MKERHDMKVEVTGKPKELPMLVGIAALMRWTEELVFLLSGPGLTLAAGIAVTDLLTHGAILAGHAWMLLTWGVLTAVGCESQLVGCFDKLRQAVIHRRWWTVVGWLVLGLALGYVTFVSVEVFAYQQSQGLNEAQALAQLGISATAWLWQRSLLSVGLVALAGFNRYRPEVRSLQDERSELERELTLEPLRQKVREVKAVGAVSLTRTVAQAAAGKHKPKAPKGPGSPTAARPTADDGHHERPAVLRLTPGRQAAVTYEGKARRVLKTNPALGKRALAKLVGCSESTAGRLRKKLLAETVESEQYAQ
jgi:hypothetical protein